MTEETMIILLIIIAAFLFGGEPDITDAVISNLMTEQCTIKYGEAS